MVTRKLALGLVLTVIHGAVLADGGGCQPTAATQRAAEEHLNRAEAAERAGRYREAYEATMQTPCFAADSQVEKGLGALRRRTSLKLGEEAETQGKLAEALRYYRENFHGIAEDRVRMKLATANPGDFRAVQEGVAHLRNVQKILKDGAAGTTNPADAERARRLASQGYRSRDTAEAMDPERKARLAAVDAHLRKLQAIATKEGEKYLGDEERIFAARRKSVTAKRDSLDELAKARAWLGLFGQAGRSNDRAEQRAGALLAEDARNSLELALRYYEFADDAKGMRRAQDKARRMGDAHLAKGEKKVAAEYYQLAGLGDKASAVQDSYERDSEKSEAARRKSFKQEQDDLEKALKM